MEKFSAYRDPGTGIQPFLRPVPPQEHNPNLAILLAPITHIVAVARAILIVCSTIIYMAITKVLFIILLPLGSVHRSATRFTTLIIARFTLFLVGVYWIPVEVVKRRKGRVASKENWNPKSGDVIVSNWISWLEILWLAYRFDPVFVLPVATPVESTELPTPASPRSTPGRRTGTGSAAVSTPPARAPSQRANINGFVERSLLQMINSTGNVPPFGSSADSKSLKTFEDLRTQAKIAGRPIVIFPECTTSNARGLLRFGNVFKGISVPPSNYNVFIMCARIDPPNTFAPTLSHTIPSKFLNPLSHVYSIATSPLPRTLSIRLLSPSDTPGSPTFQASEFVSSMGTADPLSSICATLMGDIGRMKQVGLGWEDKARFFDFFRSKHA